MNLLLYRILHNRFLIIALLIDEVSVIQLVCLHLDRLIFLFVFFSFLLLLLFTFVFIFLLIFIAELWVHSGLRLIVCSIVLSVIVLILRHKYFEFDVFEFSLKQILYVFDKHDYEEFAVFGTFLEDGQCDALLYVALQTGGIIQGGSSHRRVV